MIVELLLALSVELFRDSQQWWAACEGAPPRPLTLGDHAVRAACQAARRSRLSSLNSLRGCTRPRRILVYHTTEDSLREVRKERARDGRGCVQATGPQSLMTGTKTR